MKISQPFLLPGLLVAAGLCLLPFCPAASATMRDLSAVTDALPVLPGENSESTRIPRLDMSEESVSLGAGDQLGKWNARLDEYQHARPSLTVDYGLQVNDKIGTGGSFTHQSDYSEALISGVYAYKPNVRLRLATGQLWANSDLAVDGNAPRVLQNSAMVNARKYWDRNRGLSSLGISWYRVQANDRGINAASQDADSGLVTRVDGYIVDLGLRPFAKSVLRLRRESSSLNYGTGERPGSVASNRISFTRTFDNCVRLEGQYQVSSLADRLDFRLARQRWRVSLSRTLEDGGADVAMQIGYTIPLSGGASDGGQCGNVPGRPPSFGKLVDAVTARPSQFPRAPLTQIDAESAYGDPP